MMNRRDFIAAATRQAAAAAAATSPLLIAASSASNDIYDRLAGQLEATRTALGERLDAFGDELRSVSGRVQRLEVQQQVLLYLLLLSFIFDGGLTWLALHAPVVPLA